MEWLFDTSPFVPRAYCGEWPTWLVILAVGSDFVIAIAYYAIPFVLISLYRRRKTYLPKSWILILFALFIFGCGTTHLIDGIIYKWPHYRLLILTDVLTAGISIITAAVLPSVTRFISSLRSIEELEEALKLAQDERDNCSPPHCSPPGCRC